MEMTEHRVMAELAGGKNPGPASSMLKTRGTEMRQRLDEIAIETIAYYSASISTMRARRGRISSPSAPPKAWSSCRPI